MSLVILRTMHWSGTPTVANQTVPARRRALPSKDDPQMTDPTSPPVLDDPAELTGAWVSAALATTGIEVELTDVRPERVGTGQIGTSYRLHLTYADPAAAATAGAPAWAIAAAETKFADVVCHVIEIVTACAGGETNGTTYVSG